MRACAGLLTATAAAFLLPVFVSRGAAQSPEDGPVKSTIRIYDLKNGQSRALYTGQGFYEAPAWSADGKYLTYDGGPDHKLYRISVSGGEPELVDLGIPKVSHNHGFSLDGRLLGISLNGQLFVANADGSDRRPLTQPPDIFYFHAWSPNSRWMTGTRRISEGSYGIFRISLDGSHYERMTNTPSYDDGADYSPDAKWVYFNSNRAGTFDIWRMPAEGAGPEDNLAERVTTDAFEDWFPHPSPDGKWLALMSYEPGTTVTGGLSDYLKQNPKEGLNGFNDLAHPYFKRVVLRLRPLPGAKVTPASVRVLEELIGGQGTLNLNSWSPDSQRFAYVSYEVLDGGGEASGGAVGATHAAQAAPGTGYRSKVAIYDLASRSSQVIYQAEEILEAPNWSHDGKSLLINAGGNLYRLPLGAGSSAKRELIELGKGGYRCNNDHGYSWDGTRLAFSAKTASSSMSQVYAVNSDGSGVKLITPSSPSYFHGWSPDGKWLAFVGARNNRYGLYRVSSDGGPEEQLTSNGEYDDGPEYTPAGDWIYFNSKRNGAWDIWRMPPGGAGPNDVRAVQVTSDELEDWFPHISPDGKWIVFLSLPKGTLNHDVKLSGVKLRMVAAPGSQVGAPAIQTLATFFGGQGTINVNSWSPDSNRFAYVIYEPLPIQQGGSRDGRANTDSQVDHQRE